MNATMAVSGLTASTTGNRWPEGERGAFGADALSSWTLPSRYYSDPAIHERELKRIFERAWCYVGHQTDLPSAGSYFTDEIAHQPIVLLRDRDGKIRAFYNVCQHRGHILLKDRGTLAGKIVCPYHAWSYGLDGALSAAPMTNEMACFDKKDFGLRQLPVAIVAGLVFVNLDKSARPLEEGAAGFEQTILEALPDMPAFMATDRLRYEIAANWKIVVDNFSEGYHIPVAHPDLAKLHGRRTTAAIVGERFAFYRGVGRTSFDAFEVKPDEPYLTWQLWPHHCMLSLPGSANFIMLRMAPDGPGRCIERADIYAPPGELPASFAVIRRLFAEIFNREDVAIVESVHRGLASLGYDQGRYVVDKQDGWYSESALHRFHMQVLQALSGDGER